MCDQDRLEFLNTKLSKAAEDLGEYFEAVQIIAVHQDENATALLTGGAGNVFTRNGAVQEYVAQIQLQRMMRTTLPIPLPPEETF
jgi:hypothetical protein